MDATRANTRVGDAGARTALHGAANALLTRATKFSMLNRWAMDVARRRGMRRAKLARRLLTVLHRIWADGTEFVRGKDPAAAAAA
jgi:transposase